MKHVAWRCSRRYRAAVVAARLAEAGQGSSQGRRVRRMSDPFGDAMAALGLLGVLATLLGVVR